MLTQGHKRFITAMILATVFWIIFFYCQPVIFSLLLLGILGTILIQEWTRIFKTNKYLFWLVMPIYPVLPFMILLYMNHTPEYRELLYYLFLIVFSFDTSSYLTGILIGSHKVLPTVSPNKTIEGCIGGFIGSLFVFYGALWEANLTIAHSFIIPFVLITCSIAFLGDLFESFLKRQANLKDSGNALPGHGGFLDRFDAVMMVTFFFFIFRSQLIKILS